MKNQLKKAMGVHELWYTLCKYLCRWYYNLFQGIKNDLTLSKRKYKEVAFDKVVGYQAMKQLDQFSKKYPEVVIVHCDDNTFSNSSICLIPYESEKDYMGTTLLFVPQVSSDRNVLFLYPKDLDALVSELKKLQKRQRGKSRRGK